MSASWPAPWIAALSIVATISGLAAQDQADDLKRLAGRWVVISAEEAGAKKEKIAGVKVLIKGDILTWDLPGLADEKLRLRLDPTKNPKQIDITKSKDEILLGIYSLDTDTLKLCILLAESGKRPEEFATKKGNNHRLLVLKREK